MAASQNGWRANDSSVTENLPVPGTNVKLRVRRDSPGLLLIEVASAFHRLVESIDNARGGLDDWGYAERPISGGSALSNHASGTAIDVNATKHPLGVSPTFTPTQVTKIREIVSVTQRVVRWGGDYTGRKDEMHFEINDGRTLKQCDDALKWIRDFNGGVTSNPSAAPEAGVIRNMKRGDKGPEVENLQRVLNAWYPWLNLFKDGIFGQKTEDAVKHLQRNAMIVPDGIVGPVTRSVLGI